MASETITVVIPCFNASAYIEAAVGSALAQRSPGVLDVEIFVVDDASTDDSAAKVEAVAAANPGAVRLLPQPRNTGPAAARNLGLRHAAGRFVCFLDADDQYAPGFFAFAVSRFRLRPSLAAISCDVELVNCHRAVHRVQYQAVVRALPSNIIVKTAIAQLLGGFPEDTALRGSAAGEDCLFRTLLAKTFEVGHTERKFLRYLVRPGSHFDYFLDRTEAVGERLVFKQDSPEEMSGAIGRATGEYEERCFRRIAAAFGSVMPRPADDPGLYQDVEQFEALRSQFADVNGFLHPVEGYALHRLARTGPSTGKIVEIGSFMGLSTCWLAAGSKAARRRPVVAVDHFRGSPEHQTGGSHQVAAIAATGSTYRLFQSNIRNKGLADWVEARTGHSHEIARDWSGPIRLLFIDGDHSYEETRRDVEAWNGFIGEEGLMAFHDVGAWPGVTKFYDDFLAAGAWREVMRVRSLRVVQRAG